MIPIFPPKKLGLSENWNGQGIVGSELLGKARFIERSEQSENWSYRKYWRIGNIGKMTRKMGIFQILYKF